MFTTTARSRLCQTNAKCPPNPSTLFTRRQSDGGITPTPQLTEALARARSLYGAGMGFASLGVLEAVVKATIGLRWEAGSEMSEILALVDADISQAIQVKCFLTHLIACRTYDKYIRVPKKRLKLGELGILRSRVK